jgi:hypothetical protein
VDSIPGLLVFGALMFANSGTADKKLKAFDLNNKLANRVGLNKRTQRGTT